MCEFETGFKRLRGFAAFQAANFITVKFVYRNKLLIKDKVGCGQTWKTKRLLSILIEPLA